MGWFAFCVLYHAVLRRRTRIQADYMIGNCVSSFTGIAVREREFQPRSSFLQLEGGAGPAWTFWNLDDEEPPAKEDL